MFGVHGPRLARAGYEVIPIALGQKRPAIDGWQDGGRAADWLPRYAACGVGILTRTTPALDVDVLDHELAEAIQRLAERILGDAPYRIGQAPKVLLPFRLRGEPFAKVKVTWRGIGDERHEPTRPPAVEILTAGQQFVALGVHPATGQPYRWHRDPDLSIPRDLLPPLDQHRAERFARALAGTLERTGAHDVRLSGAKEQQDRTTTKPTRRPVTTGQDDAARVAAALERIGNADMHYDDWIRVGHAIKAALPGGDGQRLWEWWSSLSAKNDPRLTARKWATFNPHSVSAGTIFYLARGSAR